MAQTRTRVKILYTLNSSSQLLLARTFLPTALPQGQEFVPLSLILAAICRCSPELTADSARDWSVYALDPREARRGDGRGMMNGGVLEGKGLLSWVMGGEEEVLGRVSETGEVEVALRLQETKAVTQQAHLASIAILTRSPCTPAPPPQSSHSLALPPRPSSSPCPPYDGGGGGQPHPFPTPAPSSAGPQMSSDPPRAAPPPLSTSTGKRGRPRMPLRVNPSQGHLQPANQNMKPSPTTPVDPAFINGQPAPAPAPHVPKPTLPAVPYIKQEPRSSMSPFPSLPILPTPSSNSATPSLGLSLPASKPPINLPALSATSVPATIGPDALNSLVSLLRKEGNEGLLGAIAGFMGMGDALKGGGDKNANGTEQEKEMGKGEMETQQQQQQEATSGLCLPPKAPVQHPGLHLPAPAPAPMNALAPLQHLPAPKTEKPATKSADSKKKSGHHNHKHTDSSHGGNGRDKENQAPAPTLVVSKDGPCSNCGRVVSTVWRRERKLALGISAIEGAGEENEETVLLCNPCGIYQKHYNIPRPAQMWGDPEMPPKGRKRKNPPPSSTPNSDALNPSSTTADNPKRRKKSTPSERERAKEKERVVEQEGYFGRAVMAVREEEARRRAREIAEDLGRAFAGVGGGERLGSMLGSEMGSMAGSDMEVEGLVRERPPPPPPTISVLVRRERVVIELDDDGEVVQSPSEAPLQVAPSSMSRSPPVETTPTTTSEGTPHTPRPDSADGEGEGEASLFSPPSAQKSTTSGSGGSEEFESSDDAPTPTPISTKSVPTREQSFSLQVPGAGSLDALSPIPAPSSPPGVGARFDFSGLPPSSPVLSLASVVGDANADIDVDEMDLNTPIDSDDSDFLLSGEMSSAEIAGLFAVQSSPSRHLTASHSHHGNMGFEIPLDFDALALPVPDYNMAMNMNMEMEIDLSSDAFDLDLSMQADDLEAMLRSLDGDMGVLV